MIGKKLIAVAGMALAGVFVMAILAQGQEQVIDKKSRLVTKVTFVHFRAPHVKPGGGGGSKPGDTGYYTYLANGAKWRTAEDVYVNPANGESATTAPPATALEAVALSMQEWETPGTANINVFGSMIATATGPDGAAIAYNGGANRGYNTISFGSYAGDPNVIAITTVWGVFGGPQNKREITETHILMNDAYEWGDATADANLMDIENILTHEVGHCAGMGDLYTSGATQETMYGYSSEGEIKKRDLYKGDITGITKLYQP